MTAPGDLERLSQSDSHNLGLISLYISIERDICQLVSESEHPCLDRQYPVFIA